MKISTYKLLIYLSFLLVASSCTKIRFNTLEDVDWKNNANNVCRDEVSVRNWITYLVTTSVNENDTTIYLRDHLDKIGSKLPKLGLGGMSNYVIKAFLKKENDMVVQDVYDYCSSRYIKIYVAKTAWDSIRKLNMLDLPIVGITYEQAVKYVEYIQKNSDECDYYQKKKYNGYKRKFYLPSPQLFDSIQTFIDSTNTLGCNLFNYKNSLCSDCPTGKKYKNHFVLNKTGKEPTYVYAYFPDKFGLYNFKGNVAEMTSVKGIAKGGSCHHYAYEAYEGNSQYYLKPEIWLGFRVWYSAYKK